MYVSTIKIVEAIGLPAAMKFCQSFGGTRIYVPLPENLDAGNEIAKAIGLQAALTLAQALEFDRNPDRRIEVPLARRQLIILMREEIVRDRERMTERQMARKYKTTQRHIRRIVAESGQPKPEQLRFILD